MERVRRGWILALAVLATAWGCERPHAPVGTHPDWRFMLAALEERAPWLDAVARRELAGALIRAEVAHDVDPLLLLAIVEQESHFDPTAESWRGALGIMQVRPATGRAVARRHGLTWTGPADLLDPGTNVYIGAAYLAEMLDEFGNLQAALTAYNMGPRRTRRLIDRGRAPTSGYAESVLRRYDRLLAQAGYDAPLRRGAARATGTTLTDAPTPSP